MDEKKHLFNSTEKSDFIVNMTKKQYEKLGFLFLSLSTVLLFLMNIPYYASKGGIIFNYSSLSMLQTMKFVDSGYINSQCSSYISYLQIALFAVGFIGFLILVVSATKHYFTAKDNKIFLLVVIYLLFVVVSTLMAYNVKSAFFGRDYRYSGMLTLFSYIGLFIAASQTNCRNKRKVFLDIFMAIAVVNAVYGILQVLPSYVEKVPNFFYDLVYVNGNSAASYEHFIADGLVQTPHALAALMTMALGIGAAGFLYEEKSLRKTLYGISCLAFVAAGISTCTVAAYMGMSLVLLAIAVIEIVKLATKHVKHRKNIYFNSTFSLVLLLAGCGAVAAFMYFKDRIVLYDYNIIWTDCTSRINASFPQTTEISGWHIYPYIWRETLDMLRDTWVFGGGPDCIGNAYYGTNTLFDTSLGFSIDRSYNEYLDIALSCGIPCLIIYLSMGFVTIKNGILGVARFFRKEESWTAAAILVAVLGYGFQALTNISIITVTPIFFILVGFLWSKKAQASDEENCTSKK